MLPPLPPSPPEGPPRGTYFSRRNATQPLPPSPAFTKILASSTNTRKSYQEILRGTASECGTGKSKLGSNTEKRHTCDQPVRERRLKSAQPEPSGLVRCG